MFVCVLPCGNTPISGTASGVNPEEKSGAGVPGLRHFVVDFSIILATPVTALVPDYMGSCPSLGLHQGRGKGGTSVTWRACLPYHPCPGLLPGEDPQRRCKATTQHKKCAAPVPTDRDF